MITLVLWWTTNPDCTCLIQVLGQRSKRESPFFIMHACFILLHFTPFARLSMWLVSAVFLVGSQFQSKLLVCICSISLSTNCRDEKHLGWHCPINFLFTHRQFRKICRQNSRYPYFLQHLLFVLGKTTSLLELFVSFREWTSVSGTRAPAFLFPLVAEGFVSSYRPNFQRCCIH